MESFDQSLKYLLQHEPADFIRFGLADPTVQILEPVPSGLPSRSRDIDGVYLVVRGESGEGGEIADEDKRVVHIEFHRRHQSLDELGVDVAEAQIRLFRRERRKVASLVWDLYGDAAAPVLGERTLVYGEAGSQCVYQRVNLRGMRWQELLAQGPPGLWSLVALTQDGQSEVVIEQTRAAIEGRTAWSSAERADHLAVLWFVAEAEGVPARVMRAHLSEERLMESELYKSIFEKGEARGEAKGKAEAYAEALVRLLRARLGEVELAVQERIRATSDVKTLEAWYDEAVLAVDADAARKLVEKIQNATRA